MKRQVGHGRRRRRQYRKPHRGRDGASRSWNRQTGQGHIVHGQWARFTRVEWHPTGSQQDIAQINVSGRVLALEIGKVVRHRVRPQRARR